MNADEKTYQILLTELQQLRQRVEQLETADARQKEAGKALQQSEQRYKTLVDASSEGVAITESGIIIDANDQLGRMLGYDPNEMLGKMVLEMVAPASREKVAEAHRSQTQEPYEHLALHKDGTTFPVEVRGRSVVIGGRKLRFTTIRDIRESKRMHRILEEERNLMRTLIDNLPDLIFVKDAEGRYLLNNRSHLLSIGAKSQDEVLGRTSYDFNPGDLASLYTEDEKRVIQSGKALYDKEEIALHRELGEKRWHLTSKVPIVDSHGTVTGVVGIARDITERKEAEEALQQERILLRTVIDNLPGLIFYKDTKGRYLLNNQQHLRSIGARQQEDVLGKTTFDFNPGELAELYTKDEEEVIRTGKALYNVEERALHRDTGEERWHLTSKVPVVDSRGVVAGVVGIASDITERKKAEAEREKLIKELQSALADVKTLSGLVPICANCKKIRDDKGFWTQLEAYISAHTPAHFSHGICPDCMKKLYPEYS